MHWSRWWLGMAGALLVVAVSAGVGWSQAAFVSSGAFILNGSAQALVPAQVYGDDEVQANKMVQWMRMRRNRLPTADELNRSETLRAQWDAYNRMRPIWDARNKQRQEDEKRRQQELARQIEEQGKRAYDKALKDLADKKYPDAIEAFRDIINNKNYGPLKSDAQAKLGEIDQAGQAEITEARQLGTDGKYEEAFAKLGGIAARFRGVAASAAAGKEIATLQADPAVQVKIRQQRAAKILKSADDAYAAKQYVNAYTFYDDLTRNYAGTDEAKTAATKVQEMMGDPEIKALIEKTRAETEQKSILATSKTLVVNGQGEKAVPRLQDLVRKYPDSDAATEARDILTSLGAEIPVTTSAPASRPAAA